MNQPNLRVLQAVPGPKRPVLNPGARSRSMAERRFGNGEQTKKLRNRLGRLLHDEAKLREFVGKALPGARDQESAVHAMRLILRGYTIPEVAEQIGFSVPAVSGWWQRYEAFVQSWLEGERARMQMSRSANGQMSK